MSHSSHTDKSLAHLAAVVQTSRHLDDLHGNPAASRADIAKGYDQIRQGLKIAEVHALLAVAEAVRGNRQAGVTL